MNNVHLLSILFFFKLIVFSEVLNNFHKSVFRPTPYSEYNQRLKLAPRACACGLWRMPNPTTITYFCVHSLLILVTRMTFYPESLFLKTTKENQRPANHGDYFIGFFSSFFNGLPSNNHENMHRLHIDVVELGVVSFFMCIFSRDSKQLMVFMIYCMHFVWSILYAVRRQSGKKKSEAR